MRITYDPHADAAYIYLADVATGLETRCVDDDVYADFDADERLVGIEVLDASRRLDLIGLRPIMEKLGRPKVIDAPK